MPVYLGTSAIAAAYVGATAVDNIYLGTTKVWSAFTPVTVKGTANAAQSTSITIPTHAIGDLIVLYAFNSGSTQQPAKPAASGHVPAWSTIDAGGASYGWSQTAYFVATETGHTSGTWGNTLAMVAVVLTGQGATPIGGYAIGTTGAATYATCPSVVLAQTDGTSVLLHFFSSRRAPTSWGAAPTGYTKRVGPNDVSVCLDTKDDTSSDGAVSQDHASVTFWEESNQTVEIRAH